MKEEFYGRYQYNLETKLCYKINIILCCSKFVNIWKSNLIGNVFFNIRNIIFKQLLMYIFEYLYNNKIVNSCL